MIKLKLIIAIAFVLSSCAMPAADQHINLISKHLKPDKDNALVYIIRPDKYLGRARSIPFKWNSELVGYIGINQYIYFYSKPGLIKFPNRDNGQIIINIEAGSTYYLNVSMWSGYSQLSSVEGRKFITNFNLGGDFRTVLIDPISIASPSEFTATRKGITTEGNLNDSQNFLQYDDKTNFGIIRYFSQLEERIVIFDKIADVCNSKNIAIQGNISKTNGNSSYITLDEKYVNNMFEIKFQCLY